MAKARKKRQHYSNAQRTKILAAAQAGSLTATQVQKRFGVTPVTYYSWRKKAKLPPAARGRRPIGAANGVGTAGIRTHVCRRVADIVQDELRRALAELG
jgi:transposase-like protein